MPQKLELEFDEIDWILDCLEFNAELDEENSRPKEAARSRLICARILNQSPTLKGI